MRLLLFYKSLKLIRNENYNINTVSQSVVNIPGTQIVYDCVLYNVVPDVLLSKHQQQQEERLKKAEFHKKKFILIALREDKSVPLLLQFMLSRDNQRKNIIHPINSPLTFEKSNPFRSFVGDEAPFSNMNVDEIPFSLGEFKLERNFKLTAVSLPSLRSPRSPVAIDELVWLDSMLLPLF